jgi:hypothetical protein
MNRPFMAGAAAFVASLSAVSVAADDHLVMIGNSMQGCGIDFPQLSAAVGCEVKSIVSGGVLSAHKFAALWNVAHGKSKPKAAIIVFRLGNITRPTARVTGKYGEKLRAICADPELKRIVDDLAYSENAGKVSGPTFADAVERSFLPQMVHVAAENDIRLILVRFRSRRYAERPGSESEAMAQYSRDLTAYLEKRSVHFLDYVDEPLLTADCYANGDHFNEKGKGLWTPMVAADLKAILAGRRGPHERTAIPVSER